MNSPPPPPITPLKLPRYIDTIDQVSTGKATPFHGLPTKSGIYKTPPFGADPALHHRPAGDERVYPPHQGPEKALMQYPPQNYAFWRSSLPQSAHLFTNGGFGENIGTENGEMSEENMCVGDVYAFGKEVVVQVTEPRAPCFKLIHRFQVKDTSKRSQDEGKTGMVLSGFERGVPE